MEGFYLHKEELPEKLSEEETTRLLKEYKNGSYESFEKLITHNIRLVNYEISKFHTSKIEKDDLVSLGTIALINAIKTYDETKNIKLSTYIAKCVYNKILQALKKEKNRPNTISLEETISESDNLSKRETLKDNKDLQTDIENQELVESINEIISSLPEKRKALVSLCFGLDDNTSLSEIEASKTLNISHQWTSYLLHKTLETIKEELLLQQLVEINKYMTPTKRRYFKR